MSIMFEYATKVVCGKSDGSVVAPGRYWTAVNVHNPASRAVGFRWKVAVAAPYGKPGFVSDFADARLHPDEAVEIDCSNVFERAKADGFVKGFVVIQSQTELDVVAVYTAAGAEETVTAIDVERVEGRRLQLGLPDLIPAPDDNGNFCRMDSEGRLQVTVLNQGAAPAGPSITEVDFGSFGKVTQPTPALAAGASVELTFNIPGGCFSSDCSFAITVDVNDDVTESDETNNVADGTCIG